MTLPCRAAISLLVAGTGPLHAQSKPTETTGKPQSVETADPWQPPAVAGKAELAGDDDPREVLVARFLRATSVPRTAFVLGRLRQTPIGDLRESSMEMQIEPDLQWTRLRAFLVGVERGGSSLRLRRLRLRALPGSTPSAEEPPFPKTLHVDQLEWVGRHALGRAPGPVALPAGTDVLRGLQELARAATIKDLVVGELALTMPTPETPGRLQLVLWLEGKHAAAQLARLTTELKKVADAGGSPFAKVESIQGPTPREGADGDSVVTLTIALKTNP